MSEDSTTGPSDALPRPRNPFGDGHTLLFSLLAAPTERGVASASTQEAYNLAGSNYYNPNIGKQEQEMEKCKDTETVMSQSSHLDYIWEINRDTKLTASTGYRFGYNAYSALNWAQRRDPRPDYYRYLPSYYTYMAETPDQSLTTLHHALAIR